MASDLSAVCEFASRLSPRALVLEASSESQNTRTETTRFLGALGHRVDPLPERADLRLVSLPREHYDAVWVHRALFGFKPDECRRAMASLFLTLKSGGYLFVSFAIAEVAAPGAQVALVQDDYASLIRQQGFRLLMVGKYAPSPNEIAFIAQRI